MVQAILFDLDGTIIDSELAALQAIVDKTTEWGVPVTREEASSVVGKKWEVAFDMLYERHQLPLPKEKASREIVARYQEIVRRELTIVPGVVDAIHDFRKNFRLALVSGSHRADILWALEKLGVREFFEIILGAEDYERSKPAPDGYLKAISMLGVSRDHAIIFEDSVAGLASAKAAGIRSVAITCTNHFNHDQSNADVCIPDFASIRSDWILKEFE